MGPRTSFAASDTTYHSFRDIELQQPTPASSKEETSGAGSMKMQRQDSGYESQASTRDMIPQIRHTASRRSTSHSDDTATRSSRSSCPPHHQRIRSLRSQPAYFHFPTPELDDLEPDELLADHNPPPPPPVTQHYWTSDSTRRLEYAAIDAASRGLKGWMRRNLVPDCFAQQHVAFDDDTGSVRRYRLELEDDVDNDEKRRPKRRRRGWSLLSGRRRSDIV